MKINNYQDLNNAIEIEDISGVQSLINDIGIKSEIGQEMSRASSKDFNCLHMMYYYLILDATEINAEKIKILKIIKELSSYAIQSSETHAQRLLDCSINYLWKNNLLSLDNLVSYASRNKSDIFFGEGLLITYAYHFFSKYSFNAQIMEKCKKRYLPQIGEAYHRLQKYNLENPFTINLFSNYINHKHFTFPNILTKGLIELIEAGLYREDILNYLNKHPLQSSFLCQILIAMNKRDILDDQHLSMLSSLMGKTHYQNSSGLFILDANRLILSTLLTSPIASSEDVFTEALSILKLNKEDLGCTSTMYGAIQYGQDNCLNLFAFCAKPKHYEWYSYLISSIMKDLPPLKIIDDIECYYNSKLANKIPHGLYHKLFTPFNKNEKALLNTLQHFYLSTIKNAIYDLNISIDDKNALFSKAHNSKLLRRPLHNCIGKPHAYKELLQIAEKAEEKSIMRIRF
jgi:hypothetical protein